ncbi:MBL fold metallo-hydrolase [Streptomyces sp. NPDC048305]|uniref:MBL fold metallo-hydrolase n=1 Tax=Streptomyces sp. NPDC048305 TaxID=3365532 RepID=UPI003717E482
MSFPGPPTRRGLLGAAFGLGLGAGCVCTTAPPAAARPAPPAGPAPSSGGPPPDKGTHLVMLGTQGGPIPGRRAATSTALVVNGAVYLVDAGSGLPVRFYELGLDFARVRAMFITHLHSDHYADAFNFFSVNWTNWDFPSQQVQVHGPGRADRSDEGRAPVPGLPSTPYADLVRPDLPTPGIVDFFEASVSANAYDINERLRSTRRSDGVPMDLTGTSGPALMVPHGMALPEAASFSNRVPVMKPVHVYEDDLVRVTAVLVDHPPVFPAFAFRFETADETIVFSGDTSPNDNLMEFARGADILVNEVMDIDAATAQFAGLPIEKTMQEQFTSAHTPSRDWTSPVTGRTKPGVGNVARRTDVGALVLNHVYPGDGTVPDSRFHNDARGVYRRTVVVSRDLMVLDTAELSARRTRRP